MLNILFLFTGMQLFAGIYDYTITDCDGKQVRLSDFKGKMILLVNTASSSKYADQYASLEKLYQLHKDSLVIIAFPSNSFGKETADDASIRNTVKSRYKINYILAKKTEVKGENQEPLYNWLTGHARTKQILSNNVANNFYKFLIDASGNVVAAFDNTVDPMSEQVLSAIQNR